jgi:hypothetical protein
MPQLKITENIHQMGIDPDEFILFLRDSLHDARSIQELRNILLTPEDRILLEIRLTNVECILLHMERERL